MTRPAHRLPTQSSTPVVAVHRRAADRLRAGHVWVYRSDVASAPPLAPGALVEVADPRGRRLGSALASTASQIALRLIARDPLAGPEALAGLIRGRLQEALEYRCRVVRDSDAFRLVFSEADGLPGLIVDRYHDVLTLQALTQAFDQPALRGVVAAWLAERFPECALIERVEPRIRELEKLPPAADRVLRRRPADLDDAAAARSIITMNGVRFHYDGLAGQKTGLYLDQRENYAAAEKYAGGEALDVFCYQGGFALHLARVSEQVTAVDSSRPALEVAERNEELNRASHAGREIEWIEANAFDLLRDYAHQGRQFSTIVLDPPAFAHSSRNQSSALRAYKEINLRALKMLRPQGTLITCCCSYHVSEAEFLDAVFSAVLDARRTLRLLERRGAAKDHPQVLGVPETSYLKCVIAVVG